MRYCGLWPSLSQASQSTAAVALHMKCHYKKNDVIYRNADNPDQMYFLLAAR